MIVTQTACRGIINKTGGFLSGFTHTINPYHGCSLGATLCGVPDYAPSIVGGFGERRTWGRYLDVKANAPEVYDADYDRIRRGPSPALRIYMSSVTDPYVPQERQHRVTAGILDRMRRRPPDLLAIQTHTPNPLWDLDRLVELSSLFPLSIQISVETDREHMGPLFPPHAYPVRERLEALGALRARGVETVGVVSPLWPIDDVEGFARRLDAACGYVVVDHWRIGDGSRDGARTRQRIACHDASFPDLLERAGFGEWNRLEALERVVGVFRRVLGHDRVGVSRAGFHAAGHRLLHAAT
jgi:DNA repair photolyase